MRPAPLRDVLLFSVLASVGLMSFVMLGYGIELTHVWLYERARAGELSHAYGFGFALVAIVATLACMRAIPGVLARLSVEKDWLSNREDQHEYREGTFGHALAFIFFAAVCMLLALHAWGEWAIPRIIDSYPGVAEWVGVTYPGVMMITCGISGWLGQWLLAWHLRIK